MNSSSKMTSGLSDEAKANLSAFLRGMLLVIIQIFVLPWQIITDSFETLARWGARGKLPSASSELPVLTFMIIDLKPFVIMVVAAISVLGALPTLGLSLIVGYVSLPLISYSFEIVAMFISAANSLKRIEKK